MTTPPEPRHCPCCAPCRNPSCRMCAPYPEPAVQRVVALAVSTIKRAGGLR